MNSPLIVALDFGSKKEALSLADRLDPSLCALKVGSELFTAYGPALIRSLQDRHFKIFLDLKFHDIPNTVARACAVAADLGVWMLNVHALGGLKMMQAAVAALHPYAHNAPQLLAVTVLTSMLDADLKQVGFLSALKKQVLSLAVLAQEAGVKGVVCSAHEVMDIKYHCGKDFLCVTPGLRFDTDDPQDQARYTTPEYALQAGSDYLVMGRSITRSPDPQAMLLRCLALCS